MLCETALIGVCLSTLKKLFPGKLTEGGLCLAGEIERERDRDREREEARARARAQHLLASLMYARTCRPILAHDAAPCA